MVIRDLRGRLQRDRRPWDCVRGCAAPAPEPGPEGPGAAGPRTRSATPGGELPMRRTGRGASAGGALATAGTVPEAGRRN